MRKKGSMQVYKKITSILVILLMVFSTGFSNLPVGVLQEGTPDPAETPTPTEKPAPIEEPTPTEEPTPPETSENIAPAITLLEPAGDAAVTQGEMLRIAWQDEDPDDNALISLAFDLDEDPLNAEGHTWIVQDLEEDADEEGDEYEWDTTDIPEGEYYLWVEIVDGTNPAAYSFAPGKVTIQEPAPTEEPALEPAPTVEPTLEPTPTEEVEEENPYYTLSKGRLKDGTEASVIIINGPPEPPAGYKRDVVNLTSVDLREKIRSGAAATLTVPAFNWSFGCSATSAAMIAGYFDRNGFSNMYTGPTNGGVMPLDNSSWPNWVDSGGATRHQCPLSATHNGLDGRTTNGHVDDYWIEVYAEGPDPYVGNWSEHTWGDCVADYMRTSIWEHEYENIDGATTFWIYPNNTTLSCGIVPDDDGTLGLKNFYESRGYAVSECYTQTTDNLYTGAFSFENYKTEIDAGYPVMFYVTGHTMVGVGYSDPDTVILHDTWDYSNHTMPWGGSYAGMEMGFVSIVHPFLDDNYEENNTLETAYDLSVYEQAWLSTINGPGIQADDDWYEIYVTPGEEEVLVDVQFTHSEGDIDVALINPSGTTLDSSASTTNNEYIDYNVPSGGTYYIKVYNENTGNEYDLWWNDILPPAQTLTVSKTGTGSGSVTSSPAGIDCGIDCSETYSYGTEVTLTASADTGSTFTGWSGDCTGTSTCVLSMIADKSVTAEFTEDLPAGAQTIKPRGTSQDHTPEYKWTKISGATKYQFQVIKRGGDVLIDKVDKSPSCDATACYNTPSYWLKDSPYKWRVRSYKDGVWSTYSAYKRFYISNPFTANFNNSMDNFRVKAGTWGTTSTALYTDGTTPGQFSTIYHKGSIYDDFTYTARVKREDDQGYSNFLAVRTGVKVDPVESGLYWSYYFGYVNSGYYAVYARDKADVLYQLQPWTYSSAIVNSGWNTLKVTASDTTFKFYINGTKVIVINNPTPALNKGYVALLTAKGVVDDRFLVDYATLTMPSASAAADTSAVSAEQEALNQAALRAGVTGSPEGYFGE